jgi:hypothetical protein
MGEGKGLKAPFFKKDRNIQISPEFRSGCTVESTVVLLYILAWGAHTVDGTVPRAQLHTHTHTHTHM